MDAVIERIAFWVFSVLAVVSGLMVVALRNPVANAMWLVSAFVAVAGLYLTMDATFLTAVQVLVYAGAIMVLFLFVIMLLNLEQDPIKLPTIGRLVGAGLSLLLLFGAVTLVVKFRGPEGGESLRPGTGTEIGRVFFSDYVFAFEMASLLLLVAMIGAIVVARKRSLARPESRP